MPRTISHYVDNWLRCGGTYSMICDNEIDSMWQRFTESLDLSERAELVTQAQNRTLDEYYYVPIYINSFTLGVGPRVEGSPDSYIKVPMSALPGPPEDFRVKAQ